MGDEACRKELQDNLKGTLMHLGRPAEPHRPSPKPSRPDVTLCDICRPTFLRLLACQPWVKSESVALAREIAARHRQPPKLPSSATTRRTRPWILEAASDALFTSHCLCFCVWRPILHQSAYRCFSVPGISMAIVNVFSVLYSSRERGCER